MKFCCPNKSSVSFFISDINLTNRPPNNFLPNQKNCSVSSEYRMHLVSFKVNHWTTSAHNRNAIFFNGNFFSYNNWKKSFTNVTWPSSARTFKTSGISFYISWIWISYFRESSGFEIPSTLSWLSKKKIMEARMCWEF